MNKILLLNHVLIILVKVAYTPLNYTTVAKLHCIQIHYEKTDLGLKIKYS